MLGLAGQIKVEDGTVSVDRVIEEGRQSVNAKLPAVLSVVQSIGEPRYPSFMGIRKASKATIPVWSLANLGTSAPEAVVKRAELMNPPIQETTIEIITGERRWRAAKKAGLHTIPAVIRDVSEFRTLEWALIENIQREDLNPIEEAHAYRRLVDELQLTQDQIADAVGKDRSTIANTLRAVRSSRSSATGGRLT